ncbi:hypothetical protein BKI52_19570 [marine bacterium AO1-C]|nr:hypothetical protein BKI52_19570 [marine bacterium AO1-C]
MGHFSFLKKRYFHKSLLCLLFLSLIGAHPAMARTFAPVQTDSYLVFPLLLASYHLLLLVQKPLANSKLNNTQPGIIALALAVALSFTQPRELYYLLTFQEAAFNQRFGFTVSLLFPVFVFLTYLFFKTKTSSANHRNLLWIFIGGAMLTMLVHWLQYYACYFSIAFLAIVVLGVSGYLVRYFSVKTWSHYLFALAWGVWLSILVVQGLMGKTNYWEMPLLAMLLLFSGATVLQRQENMQQTYQSNITVLQTQVNTQQKDLEDHQATIEEKDRALTIKDKRITTNKAILEKAGKRLKEKERILKLQNKQITQSIEYARNIQEAILPTNNTLEQLFQEYFLLFRPKDIVSGDFYWCSQIALNRAPDSAMENFVYQTSKQYIFVAAIDCTGHGVPGAFMSMIGNTLLNEIVNEKDVYNPGEILETLHISIRSDLRQEHSGNTDGMDVCLCRLEKRTDGKTEVLFAGAKRDLYCLQNKELVVVQGERKSIGGVQKEAYRSFKVHKILLDKQDRIYLATDGLEDMAIGIKTRRSFGTKRLKSFITKYQHLNLEEQYDMLANLVDKYNADTEQRDDVLLLGIEM